MDITVLCYSFPHPDPPSVVLHHSPNNLDTGTLPAKLCLLALKKKKRIQAKMSVFVELLECL